MRSRCSFAVLTLCAFAFAPRAEALVLDEALMAEVASLLDSEGQEVVGTSPALPVLLDAGNELRVAAPQGRTFGIGLQLGAPTAVTIKFLLGANQGVVVGLGAGFGWYGGFGPGLSLHADYLFDVAQLVKNDTLALSFYIGPGLWLALFRSGYGFGVGYYYYGQGPGLFGLGVRMPIGISMAFSAAPIELYLEADPALFVFPGVDFGLGGSIGFRFYL
jgi:hypothetical protein